MLLPASMLFCTAWILPSGAQEEFPSSLVMKVGAVKCRSDM